MVELIKGDCRDYIPKIFSQYPHENIVLVSDPAFNIGYHYNSYSDKMQEDDYYEFMSDIFKWKPSVIIHYPESLYKLAFQMGKFPERVISWVYNSNTARQHRDIAFFDVIPNFEQVRQAYKNPNDKRIKERIANGAVGAKLYDWFEINQVKNVSTEKQNHPCQMPLRVMENVIGLLPKNALVIDPFMGSGTTGVACKNKGIDFIGIEIGSEYFKIATDRLNGQLAGGQLTLFPM